MYVTESSPKLWRPLLLIGLNIFLTIARVVFVNEDTVESNVTSVFLSVPSRIRPQQQPISLVASRPPI